MKTRIIEVFTYIYIDIIKHPFQSLWPSKSCSSLRCLNEERYENQGEFDGDGTKIIEFRSRPFKLWHRQSL